MSILGLITLFVVVGVGLYLINRFVPMEPKALKPILNIVMVIILITITANALGLLELLKVPIGHIR